MNIVNEILLSVLDYLKADWYLLVIGILLAVIINVYVDANKLKQLLERKAGMSVPAAVAFGAFTPLCACGTTAVLLSMFIWAMPWAPVMAFLVSSPLTSPSEFVFETAFLGSRFAIAMLSSSVLLGTVAGVLASWLSKNTKFFDNQFRLAKAKADIGGESINDKPTCGCAGSGCGTPVNKQSFYKRYKLDQFLKALVEIGLKRCFFTLSYS